MRCIRCGRDSKHSERTGRRCPGCDRAFAFEPQDGDPFTDMAWKHAINQVSSASTVRFVAANLHHEVARRQKRSWRNYLGAAATVGGLAFMVGQATVVAAVAVAAAGTTLGAVIGVATWRATRGLRLSRRAFDELLARWENTHGPIPGLVRPPKADHPYRTAELDAELEAYSFDRAVICDRRDIVDLLLANNFHFENNCAVISHDGHPRHAFPIVRKMLRGNPRLDVFVLHDATPSGCTLGRYLREDPGWFGGTTVRVVDVALRPAQAKSMMRSAWRAEEPVPEDAALAPEDRAWLSRWRVELAAIRPEQLIKRLYRTMQALPAAAASDDDGDALFVIDASASDGGGDSFG